MEITIPKTSAALSALLRADFTTQWSNRRAVILTLVVPVIVLFSWKSTVAVMGGPFALSNAITIGLIATGLMGYSNSIARDRDKGIFQRLRVAPIPSWLIMASRLIVQMAMIILITTIVFIAGNYFDGITLTPAEYALTFITAIVGGAVYLGLGQLIVGLIVNPETVNSTTRLVYFVFILVGMFGELIVVGNGKLSVWDKALHNVEHWSPYGTVKTIVAAGMELGKWNNDTSMAFLLTVLYIVVFSTVGIKQFKWNSK